MSENDYFEIRGGVPLRGSVTISGSKNAALPILCACVLAEDKCRIENLPNIEDINRLLEILSMLGAGIERISDSIIEIDPSTINGRIVTPEMASKLRASYYMLGALLARFGEVEITQPGGCRIGQRPMDFHIKGMRALGAEVSERGDVISAKAERLVGADIVFDMASVGATINVMLAACRAEGRTTITNAAREPHVVDVANFLNTMGANIRGAGTDIIRINGRQNLHGCTYAVIPDQIEAGTYMIAAAATKGDVIIRNVIPTHLESVTAKLLECGTDVQTRDDGNEFVIQVRASERPRAVNIKTMPYPGFPTDLQQPMSSMLTLAEGRSMVTENLFENRFNHCDELVRMGAKIIVNGRTATIEGVERLYGTSVKVTDLRAGAAMIVAALVAEGTTKIRNIYSIDRGYERLEEKLTALGAGIRRIREE
ncbi:MAG: UDP-N-acetylglucosamine 1-carboxyvinyltransferase [Christensenellales bacterium]|nr:UDP-N-acetylglucosamine 1-carboxyvinyltransferase [Clostridium sp.]MDY5002323.1 UDP-N-acetylglucosamine 1-carboxyvinyltransferase [Eubacteriales bacterium]MCI6817457.1 UDP-N-acetylglucosamine 1-carboxyvinyltransferase [Clostridium sp.]MCI6987134.1 UDP-N-acetylglucosamine 1-carboxyvinyltransferase [Clostridium sp.]MDD5981869.1 UDP-N-acetylglucosamine 1-carboxyvinyltransferase [Clostridium sp.]